MLLSSLPPMSAENPRSGPKPLAFHLSLADTPQVQAGSADLSKTRDQFLNGIRRYRKSNYRPERAPSKKVWSEGCVSMRRISAHAEEGSDGKQPLLLVPSLINDSTIFDLDAHCSFARMLSEQGFAVHILDWGDLCQDHKAHTLETLVSQRLMPAVEALQHDYGHPVSALGYCMGGTLLAAAAALKKDNLSHLVFLTTPWDFGQTPGHFHAHIQKWAPDIQGFIQKEGRLAAPWVQSFFAMRDPEIAREKFMRFAEIPEGSNEEKRFIATEDWLNSARDLPGTLMDEIIQSWYRDNQPGRNKWRIAGQYVTGEGITARALFITAHDDKLVDCAAKSSLFHDMKKASVITLKGGHLSPVAGRRASKTLWPDIAEFLSS